MMRKGSEMKNKRTILVVFLCVTLVSLTGCEAGYGFYGKTDVPPLVEQWREDVEFYADMYNISEYVDLLLAIIAQESGGDSEATPDIMQCSASAGLENNAIEDPRESIRQGVWYFSTLLDSGTKKGVDMDTVLQSYNFSGGYITYISRNEGGSHSESAARAYSAQMCERYGYSNYGDVLYVEHVRSWLEAVEESEWSGDYESMLSCMEDYLGVPYLFGGNGKYGIDCSALMQKVYKSTGVTLPRTAQAQYDAVEHIEDEEVEPGDLVFFSGTYDTDAHITHVGVYVGEGKMFHASSGRGYCCYSSIETSYYQSHLAGFGRP